ncbi:MAG: hypothetical protein EBS41_04865 [Actinobacteria bacterium]|nr:hypothetical protein [Actinomycetota bacterium]
MQRMKVILLLSAIAASVFFAAKDHEWRTFTVMVLIILGMGTLMFIRKRSNPLLLEEYKAKAQTIVGSEETVLVASLMAPQEHYSQLAWAILKSSTQGRLIGSVLDSTQESGEGTFADTGATIGMLSGLHDARKQNAEKQGLTPVVLVALTAKHIYILDWARPDVVPYIATSEQSVVSTRVLMTLDRATTSVALKRNGLSAHFFFGDSKKSVTLELQGSLSPASPDAQPTKLLAENLGLSTK